MLKKAPIAGIPLRHAIQLSAGRSEKIRWRGAVLQPGNGYERFGAIHVNFRRRKITVRDGAFARVQRVVEIANPRRHDGYGCPLRAGISGAGIASEMQQRMRALPDKPAEKKDHKNRNGEPRVGRHSNGAATAAAAMMMTTMVTSMPIRAAGRDPGSQVDGLC